MPDELAFQAGLLIRRSRVRAPLGPPDAIPLKVFRSVPFSAGMSGGPGGIVGVGAIASALKGMQSAQAQAAGAASDLAQGVSRPSGPDVPGDMVTLSMAQVQMAASVQVARASNEMQKTLLDLFA